VEVVLLVPFERPDVVPRLYREEEVLSADADEQGTTVRARVSERGLSWVAPFVVAPAVRRARA
jgi:hypothetical protein